MNSLIIAANLTKRTIGNWKGVLLYILVPAMAVSLIIGLLGSDRDRPAAIPYINADEGETGAHIIRELSRDPGFALSEARDLEALKESVLTGKAVAGFVIPSGFTEAVLAGSPLAIDHFERAMSEESFTLRIDLQQAVVRITESTEALRAAGVLGSSFSLMLEETEKHRVSRTLTDYGWGEKETLGLSTGIMILFVMALIGHSVSLILEDRRLYTMMRMYAAPVRAFEIALGNFMGSFLVGSLQILILLVFTRYALGFDYGLPFGPHLLVMESFLLSVMGIASAVGGLVRSKENISALNSVVSMPMCLLGGCFWPVSIMPESMQKLASFVPQSWVMDAVKRLAAGQGLSDLTLHLGVLLLFAAVLLGFGAVILKPAAREAAS
ncbi:ABC transporter permease [Paenibacillus puerhi]|uniref:ABC transporter permease n=1 Tax=Paenibacillus puerhi TaxID=2692622 RepID=UPI00135B8A52|nr:ABC transporter permease [Paenibacillus puerhi]